MPDTAELLAIIEAKAKSFFEGARGSHGWDHVQRVVRLCERMGPKEGCGMTTLRAAALLHDIGRAECDRANGERCHAHVGGHLARDILAKAGADPAFTGAVVHCIETHRFRGGGEPETIEAKVLFDADKLDSIGAVGVGRAFQFAGEVGARLHNPEVNPADITPYGREDTARAEHMTKLRHIKDRLLTATGRDIARSRHAYMSDFFDRLDKEAAGLE